VTVADLSPAERERYQRQLVLPAWGERAQQALKQSSVFIAGAGGLGSPVALYLAAAGVGEIRICDSGRVELSNLNRQILHTEESIGVDKIRSAAERLEALNSSIRIVPLRKMITRQNIATLVGKARLMIDCLDNFQTRYILNQYAVANGAPLIHAGVNGTCGQIAFIHPPQTACLACLIPQAPPRETVPILGATAGVLGCLEAMEALKYLSGCGELLLGRLLFCECETMSFQEVRFDKDPECPVCGSGTPA